MKPFRAFLFLLFVLLSFLFIYYLIEVGNAERVGNDIVEKTSFDTIPVEFDVKENFVDTLPGIIPEVDLLSQFLDEQNKKLFNPTPFEFSPNDSSGFKQLFRKLQSIEDEKLPVRIIYFGDSQIENDRITFALRRKLQTKFGGKGLGFIPLDHIYNSGHQLILELSKDWSLRSFQDKEFKNNSFIFKNTIFNKGSENGWFRLKRIKSLKPLPDYRLMKLYYKLNGSCGLNVENSGEKIYTGEMPNDGLSRVLDFQFNRTPDDIKFNFSVDGILQILGISLESKKGVLVDNIALRGLSYPTFEWSDQEEVKTMIEQVNPGLFIFHFGVNLVPYDSEDYIYFRKHFKQQVLFLRNNYPDVPLLIVGVSDMARKQNGIFESYTNVKQIKQMQRDIAFETGSIFWDLEAFMGGWGGMIRWVNADPELGRKDYTHFSKDGAAKIGEELAKMILFEYSKDAMLLK